MLKVEVLVYVCWLYIERLHNVVGVTEYFSVNTQKVRDQYFRMYRTTTTYLLLAQHKFYTTAGLECWPP